jgi:conjugal transfer/entry exclusion protein
MLQISNQKPSLEKALMAYAQELANCQNPSLQIHQLLSFIERLIPNLKSYYMMEGELDSLLSRDVNVSTKEHNRMTEITRLLNEKHEQMMSFFMFLAPEEAKVA